MCDHSSESISHLLGMSMPQLQLTATDGSVVSLADEGLTVVYAYPRTSPPDGSTIDGWDTIAGARGCTRQACAFRDQATELKTLGVRRIFGLSTQSTAYQQEVAERLHLPFSLLSDHGLILARLLQLPIFEVGGMKLLKRITFVIDHGIIQQVFYPVASPADNARDVISWLSGQKQL